MKNSDLKIAENMKLLKVTSPAFNHMETIPGVYTCEGSNINPPLSIDKIPDETKSLVLIVDDPDAGGRVWTHWVVWNIAPVKNIPENAVPGTEGINDFTRQKYDGPCPPSGIHHYHFKVYALNEKLQINPHSTKREVEQAMDTHIIAFGEIIGLYQKAFI